MLFFSKIFSFNIALGRCFLTLLNLLNHFFKYLKSYSGFSICQMCRSINKAPLWKFDDKKSRVIILGVENKNL